MRTRVVGLSVALLLGVLGAPGLAGEAGQAETADGLKALMGRLAAAVKADNKADVETITKGLVLPDAEAWFKEVFGDPLGAEVAKDYNDNLKTIEQGIPEAVKRFLDDGRTEVSVVKRQKGDDPKELRGNIAAALNAMKKPVALYEATFAKPGEDRGNTIYSFAYAKEAFRLVGKMRPIRAPK